MPGFFIRKTGGKKRKSITKSTNVTSKKKFGQEIESESDDSMVSDNEAGCNDENEVADDEDETAQEKRLRLAKEYITNLEEDAKDDDVDVDAVAHRLQQDVMEDAGILQKFIADKCQPDVENLACLRGHRLSVTSVAVSNDSQFLFSASKDGAIIKWNLKTLRKVGKLESKHTGQVLCLALTTDFKFLASGGFDMTIIIWQPETLQYLHTFNGHRGHISSLSFRKRQHQLFSASDDKTLKVWSLDEMAYVETLFGHEDKVLGVESLMRDCAVSCAGRDGTVRLWKIPEESQLVFHSKMGASFDCVTMLNEEYFLAGADNGSLSLFHCRKKKPITLRTNAHKRDDDETTWVSAVTCLPFTDLVASGSCDGGIVLWRCEKSFRAIMPVHTIQVAGFVNSLQFTADGRHLIAGVGQEHRLGRWWKINKAKNSICVIPITISQE